MTMVLVDGVTMAASLGDVAAVVAVDVPDPTSERPEGMERLDDLLNWVMWVALAVVVAGLMAAGALMAFQSQRGEGSEHMRRIGMGLVGVIVIAAASALVSFLAT